ncbi:hypothetical protein HDV00_009118 [Rhizophlyctis rosea]|nr:hypothetical protein HDV00_009118 [Rhizophlyctis rosea]
MKKIPVTSDIKSDPPTTTSTSPTTPPQDPSLLDTLTHLRLISCCLCFATAGVNDSSVGPLIPYIMDSFSVSTALVALQFIPNLVGWLVAAGVNGYLFEWLGQGGVLMVGAGLNLNPLYSSHTQSPNFGLFAFTFFLTGFGQAVQDSKANTYVSSLGTTAHRYLGLIHAMYGVGLLFGPLISTAMASHITDWRIFYVVLVALNVLNCALVGWVFRDSMRVGKKVLFPRTRGDEGRENVVVVEATSTTTEAKSATTLLLESLRFPPIWTMSLFYFFYLGAVLSLGSWVVEFLVDIRHGDLASMGYMPMATNGGTVLGRLLLADVTHKMGERWMIVGYIGVCVAAQVVFWLVPNIAVNGVALGGLGFFSGPLFAAGVSVSTRILPKHLHTSGLGLIFVIGQAGGAAFPYITGIIASQKDVTVLQPIATALFAAAAVTWLLLPPAPKAEEQVH